MSAFGALGSENEEMNRTSSRVLKQRNLFRADYFCLSL